MQTRLLEHLTKYNILTMEQLGFRRKLTTEKASYNLTNKILNALNNKFTSGIFCHLAIFDSINHDILLSKLEFCGIIGNDNALYKFHLRDKYQRVYIYNEKINNSSLSNWATIKHSVSQGSILGPLLFLVYVYIYIYIYEQFNLSYK